MLRSARSYVNYSRLVMLSFAFQQAFQRGLQESDEVFFTKVGPWCPCSYGWR